MRKFQAYGYYNSRKSCLMFKIKDGNKIIAEGNLYEGLIHPVLQRVVTTNGYAHNDYEYEHLNTKNKFEKA
jgi:hypothetical protein